MESRIEFLSIDAWWQWHTELLQSMLNRIYSRVPFYRKLLDKEGIDPSSITNIEMLSVLPFTTREDIANNYPYDFFAVPLRDIVRIHTFKSSHTSPVVIGYTKRDLENRRFLTERFMKNCGVGPEDIVQICLDPGMAVWSLEMKEGAEGLGALVIPPDPLSAKDRIKIMRDFKSTVLVTTPSYALYLLSLTEEQGLGPEDLSLRIGIFIGETLKQRDRTRLELGFGLKAYVGYGIMEAIGPIMAYECGVSRGLHLCLDHVIPEVIDPDTGDTIFDGVGELVITTATTKANPLLRFRTGDMTRITREVCECGRTTWRMEPVSGRSDNLLCIRGINIDPQLVYRLLADQTGGFDLKALIVLRRRHFLEEIELWVAIEEAIFIDSLPRLHQWIRRVENKVEEYIGLRCRVRPVERCTLDSYLSKGEDIIRIED